jgi:predicted nucleic acid-binding protein
VAAPVAAPDSSVLIAGFLPEHLFHEKAIAVLPAVKAEGRLIAHTMAETYSVLTGQAQGHRPADVLGYLDQFLGQPPVVLDSPGYAKALLRLGDGEVRGGAIYDGLIAATAAQAGLRLLSFDRRAVRTYARLDASYEILA